MSLIKLPLGAAALTGLLLTGGCDFFGGDGGGGNVVDNSDVLAVVNGVDITQNDLESAISQLPPNVSAMPLEQLREPLMDTLIETELLAAEGRALDLHNEQDFLHELARFKVFSLREAYVAWLQEEAVTEDAVQAAYDAEVVEQELNREIDASHILVDSEEEALEVIAELDGGADFAALAQERSIGPSSETGGNLGFFQKNAMVEEFAAAAFALETGAYTAAPVQTQFGWHVILVNESRDVDPPAFQSMRGPIEQRLRQEAMENRIEELRAGAEIELNYETSEDATEADEGDTDETDDTDDTDDTDE